MKNLNMIVAVGRNMEIGCDNGLIWPIREDLRHFKALTLGHPVIMGRRTWESLPKRPLPGRPNIVISRSEDYEAPGAILCHSLEEALKVVGESPEMEEPFVIGGEQLYRAALPMAGTLHLTRVDAEAPQADAFFPSIDPQLWQLRESSDPLEAEIDGEKILYRFETLSRK